jgi:hypothetical protein
MLTAPIAEFFELNLSFYELFVLARPIIDAFTALTAKFDELFL